MKLGLFIPLVFVAHTAAAGDISLTVNGLRSGNGMLRIALFDNARDFPNGQEILRRNVTAQAGTVTVLLDTLPTGTYAIALHHDENANGKMDMGLLGLPQEGYGFSNDAPVFLGAPPFSDAAFSLPEEGKAISIRVVY